MPFHHSQSGQPSFSHVVSDIPRPVRYDWLAKIATLSGKALHIGIALAWLAASHPTSRTLLTRRVMARWSLSRDACYDGLDRLEHAGLIRVWRLPGRTPHIILTEPGTDLPLQLSSASTQVT